MFYIRNYQQSSLSYYLFINIYIYSKYPLLLHSFLLHPYPLHHLPPGFLHTPAPPFHPHLTPAPPFHPHLTPAPTFHPHYTLTSHEDRFHSMPVTSSLISLSGVLRSSLTREGMPIASLMARLFSSFCLPYDRFLGGEWTRGKLIVCMVSNFCFFFLVHWNSKMKE